jgi:hypothetical protein
MPPVGFEPAVTASERPQTYILDRTATGIGRIRYLDRTAVSESLYRLRYRGPHCRLNTAGYTLHQVCTNSVAVSPGWIYFFTAALNICGPSVWNLHYITLVLNRILKWLIDFWELFCTPTLDYLYFV